ncbi:hypothetical protein AAU61_03455 [Desulfocarbo indianensis]|nr:hypothetical protein AAU61_03455 [Desulfocarbo indianensis]
MAQRMLERGAEPHLKSEGIDKTGLELAKEGQFTDLVQALEEVKAGPAREYFGLPPIQNNFSWLIKELSKIRWRKKRAGCPLDVATAMQ